ncbi:hypothetical protein PF002_g28534 [Phytophthora fragariae]|nr:hypothetical protein PF002_g28534 [Phytophthora fragariae]
MRCRHEVTCDNARRHSSPRKKRSEPGENGGPVGDERNEAADEVTHAAHPEKLNGERYRCGAPKNVGEEDGVRNGNAGRTRLDGVHTSDAWQDWTGSGTRTRTRTETGTGRKRALEAQVLPSVRALSWRAVLNMQWFVGARRSKRLRNRSLHHQQDLEIEIEF